MKRNAKQMLLAAAGLMWLAMPALAADMDAVLKDKRCNACHDTDKSLIGPPWKAISLRYQADRQQAIDALARKIVSGGGGAWGVVPMVPNEHVSMAEAREIAGWILDLAAR
jgi:cytochrome c